MRILRSLPALILILVCGTAQSEIFRSTDKNGTTTYSNVSSTATKSTEPAVAAGPLTARDQGNGEVLLEWQAQSNVASYRIVRMAAGIPTVSLEAGSHTNVMDYAGLATSYKYQLFARAPDGSERQLSNISYSAPATVRTAAAAASGLPPQLRSALGTNLESVSYWSPQVPFVDVMKSSGEWISGDNSTWDNGQALNLDENGWIRSLAPGQHAKKLLLRDIDDRYPAGQYLVRYKGEGTLKFQFAARVISQKAGEILLEVTPDKHGIYVGIETTNPANYLRDIVITMPGGVCEGDMFTQVATAGQCGNRRFLSFADYPRSILFHPAFADRLRSYGVLRFMDWAATNGSKVKNWTERTPLSFHTWATARGAPIEVMIALANRMGAHPWFTMPHLADDNYVKNFAQTVKGRLSPALGVYAEYSNEVWNALFPQYNYALEQARLQAPAIDNMQYYALRSQATGKIFKDALTAPRVVAVLAGQAVNPWTATHGMDYLKSRGAPGIDAIAIAPYFGLMPNPEEAAKYTSMTLDSIFDLARTKLIPEATADSTKYRAAARSYGVRLIGYEGGQHMVGILGAQNNDALSTLFDAFNRDPRIKNLYATYFAGWKQAGGELFVHFNDISTLSKWGRWGALEYVSQPREQAPKFDAIQSFIEQNPVWWNQTTVSP